MRRVLPLVNLVFLISLVSCELPRASQPSILVVAVEGLSFESLSCDSDEEGDRTYQGIRALCEEGVRFSHAYTPSTMSQATMASLLTGLYPFDHGVHHNGSQFLSARFRTLAEGALTKGYHTLFVSGGAPIWRKSGLAQGFEIFDDAMEISSTNFYRPAGEVVKLATNWFDHEVGNAPFLAVLFMNDLQFPQITTRTAEGELREKSTDAQLEEVAESVEALTKWLKRKKRWNSTNLIFVGLNSLSHQETFNEPKTLSLKSASVQVSLFIKPARKENDNVIQWAVDKNVSLVDVGKTMFEWLGVESPASSIPQLEPQSLVQAVTRSSPNWKENRLILSESAWPEWLSGTSGTRLAIRQNQMLYINNRRPLIYNTLTDRLETVSLKQNDPLWNSLNGEVLNLLQQIKMPTWNGMPPVRLEQIEVARELWRNGLMERKTQSSDPWGKWYLRRALVTRDWREVKRLAQDAGNPIGVYVAAKSLGEPAALPRNTCLRLLVGGADTRAAECDDERMLALHAWRAAKSDEEKAFGQERFLRLYSYHLLDQQIGRLNFLSDLRWDVDREKPEAPQMIDYVLTLKEMEPFAKKISTLLLNKDLTF